MSAAYVLTGPITIGLPFPPPVNNLFVNNPRTRGRFKSKRYSDWIKEAGYQLSSQLVGEKIAQIKGPIRIFITFSRPDRRKRDLDGMAKAPLDLLVSHRAIEDDSMVQELNLKWSDEGSGCRVSIWPVGMREVEAC